MICPSIITGPTMWTHPLTETEVMLPPGTVILDREGGKYLLSFGGDEILMAPINNGPIRTQPCCVLCIDAIAEFTESETEAKEALNFENSEFKIKKGDPLCNSCWLTCDSEKRMQQEEIGSIPRGYTGKDRR